MSVKRAAALLWFGLLLGCGDETTAPVLTDPGYVLALDIPGLTDTTFQGDSLYWRIFSIPRPVGSPELRQLILEIVVLNPPAPLASPLVFELRWRQLEPALPAAQAYPLSLSSEVLFRTSSNVGNWAASKGQVMLTDVSATKLRGTLSATLVPVYPPGSSLPAVRLHATFSAPYAVPAGP